jgi:hypothetical protein
MPKSFRTPASSTFTCWLAARKAFRQNCSNSAPRLYAAIDSSSGSRPASMASTIFSSSLRALSKVWDASGGLALDMRGD